MPFVRRRPLLRMAAVGGVAYAGSKAGANRANEEAAQAGQPAPPPPPPPPAPAPSAATSSNDRITQLKQLADLKDSGALTQKEFESEKARILA